MKRIFYMALIVIAGCSQINYLTLPDEDWDTIKSQYKTAEHICGTVSDAIQYPTPWTEEIAKTFVTPDETIKAMSACGLLESYLIHPERVSGPWCMYCSYSNYPGVTNFNNKINHDKVVMELLGREDLVPVLAGRYISMIEQGEEKIWRKQCFEMLLASDACMSVLNAKQQIQFMAMALKMAENNQEQLTETRHIMVAVMKAFNYTPFLTEADTNKYTFFGNGNDNNQRTGLSENTWGYDVCNFDIVEKYAKRFLNDKKSEL